MTSDRTLKGMLTDNFNRRVKFTADRLRELADELEMRARYIERLPMPGTKSATFVAQTIVHDFIWGMANASVDGVVEAAEEYDRALAEDAASQTPIVNRPGRGTRTDLRKKDTT